MNQRHTNTIGLFLVHVEARIVRMPGYPHQHSESSVDKFRTLENLKAQITVVRWHLDAAASGSGDKKRRHLDGASLTYQGALELFAQVALSGEERERIVRELADLKERLRAAGQAVE